MKQISYKMEIIENLRKSDRHIRGLAKDLKTNQMMISRKIKELEDENAVDFRQEGKNKVYFLKRTLEAQEYTFISEHHKELRIIKKYPILKKIFQKIKSNPKIKLALLFGSYAKGVVNKNSDIDIYIETTDKSIEIENIDSKINLKIGKYDKNNLLIKEIEKNHVIIKGVENYYEKTKFFT